MNGPTTPAKLQSPWKILIVDDDHDVHIATRMALQGINFRGRKLEFIDAYSGAQALELLQVNPDTAIVFLDIIMETDDAGLRVAQRIREIGMELVRIIVRTGFPGQAPERSVVVDYDIHDYLDKTGLSVQKLFTTVISALRAYDGLVVLAGHQRGLMGVLESISWFDFNAVGRYVSIMLAEFSTLARLDASSIVMVTRPSAGLGDGAAVFATLGDLNSSSEPAELCDLEPETASLIYQSLDQMQALSGPAGQTLFSRNHGVDLVLFAAGEGVFAKADEVLLEVFLLKACQAISNQQTFADMEGDRNAVLRGLALRGERWDNNAAVELDRLSRLATAVATRLHTTLSFSQEIDARFIRDIGVAAMLHDLGNDEVLGGLLAKSTCYDPKERKLMQVHVAAGIKVVDGYLYGVGKSGVLRLARDIIGGHHEHFDGTGYPNGCSGDAIPLSARLVAVVDAYIAMTSPRPHRAAMRPLAAQALIKQGAGAQFDPRIVEAVLEVVGDGCGD
jgi:response regulator RpfG family c-di-GMP phosphodiesterase